MNKTLQVHIREIPLLMGDISLFQNRHIRLRIMEPPKTNFEEHILNHLLRLSRKFNLEIILSHDEFTENDHGLNYFQQYGPIVPKS